MSFTVMLELIEKNAPGILIAAFLISCFIEIVPVKFSPITWLVKQASSALNADVLKKIDVLETKLNSVDKSIEDIKRSAEEERAVTARARILGFADELLRGTRHSKESFDSILADIDYYENYCSAHPEFSNNKTRLSVKEIKDMYAERLEKRDFLY